MALLITVVGQKFEINLIEFKPFHCRFLEKIIILIKIKTEKWLTNGFWMKKADLDPVYTIPVQYFLRIYI